MYQVTATKRRPQTFDELLGQDFVSATLKKSIEMGKIANAYLFSGPRGCGKTSTARILAKAINCETGSTPNPCSKCNSCVQITNGSSLDVIEIDGASNTGVDDVRKLKDEILFPPTTSRYKVYIIDEVHMLSTNAFNALLKTIEEPPPYVVFVFATTELHKVPATIKSRCQQFNFKLVDIHTLHKALKETAAEQKIEAEDEALFWIAREGTGSVRDSYTLFDQVAAFSEGYITLEKIQDKLGLTGIELINEMVCACVNKNANHALNIMHEALNSGISVEQFTIDCAKYFRGLLLVKHGITKESILGQSAGRFSSEVLTSWTSTQMERALGIMLQLFKDINFSVNPTYELELAVSRLSWLSDYMPPDELKKAYDNLKAVLSGEKSFENNVYSKKEALGVDVPSNNFKLSQNFAQPAEKKNEQKTIASSNALSENVSNPRKTERNAKVFSKKNFANDSVEYSETEIYNENVDTPDSSTITKTKVESAYTLKEIKKMLCSEFAENSGLLSAALNETSGWELKNKKLIMQTEKAFNKVTIDKNSNLILKVLKNYLGADNLSFEVLITKEKEEKSAQKSDEPPEKVKHLMRIFQANIVDTIQLEASNENG